MTESDAAGDKYGLAVESPAQRTLSCLPGQGRRKYCHSEDNASPVWKRCLSRPAAKGPPANSAGSRGRLTQRRQRKERLEGGGRRGSKEARRGPETMRMSRRCRSRAMECRRNEGGLPTGNAAESSAGGGEIGMMYGTPPPHFPKTRLIDVSEMKFGFVYFSAVLVLIGAVRFSSASVLRGARHINFDTSHWKSVCVRKRVV